MESKFFYEPSKRMNKADEFKAITDKMLETFIAKNHDYGNSFDISLDKHGPIASIVRMEDKLNRFDTLSKKELAMVKSESIEDTLLDLANYSIMTLLWYRHLKDKAINAE